MLFIEERNSNLQIYYRVKIVSDREAESRKKDEKIAVQNKIIVERRDRQEMEKEKKEQYEKDIIYCHISPGSSCRYFENWMIEWVEVSYKKSNCVWSSEYRITVKKKGKCDLTFIDESGDYYNLWISQYKSSHLVDYESKSPNIKNNNKSKIEIISTIFL
jgi:hypothetical protein